MIPFNFIYFKPDNEKEAVDIYMQMHGSGNNPYYYGGGSEIITMSRSGSIRPGAVIDIKGISPCKVLNMNSNELIIGAANSLSTVKDSGFFPMLGNACGRIADHTNQCRITLGGNICGSIIYRETSLPFMLTDSMVLICGQDGKKTVPFNQVFNKSIILNKGEFILQFHIPTCFLKLPYIHVKKTTNEKIDYPLVNITALLVGKKIRVAFSGLCEYPFRSLDIEEVLNERHLKAEHRVEKVLQLLPNHPINNMEGSNKYRSFVLKNTLLELLEKWDNGGV